MFTSCQIIHERFKSFDLFEGWGGWENKSGMGNWDDILPLLFLFLALILPYSSADPFLVTLLVPHIFSSKSISSFPAHFSIPLSFTHFSPLFFSSSPTSFFFVHDNAAPQLLIIHDSRDHTDFLLPIFLPPLQIRSLPPISSIPQMFEGKEEENSLDRMWFKSREQGVDGDDAVENDLRGWEGRGGGRIGKKGDFLMNEYLDSGNENSWAVSGFHTVSPFSISHALFFFSFFSPRPASHHPPSPICFPPTKKPVPDVFGPHSSFLFPEKPQNPKPNPYSPLSCQTSPSASHS